MQRQPGVRILGVETEFGTLVSDPSVGTPEWAVEQIKDHIFYRLKLGAIDRVSRDEVFEPAETGGFLLNGARLYIDAVGSHLEYATAESLTPKDLIANDRAGQRLIVRAIEELGLRDVVSVYNNAIDHFGGHTFGCHENYSMEGSDDFFQRSIHMLYPFLVTRQLFAGAGRVGGHRLHGSVRPSYEDVAANPIDYIWVSQVYGVDPDPTVEFQMSQRADHILKTMASRVRFNRAIVNPKWEHYYSHEGSTRLHLLFGEPNQNEFAYALKIGTTSLAVRLLEEDHVPEHLIAQRPLIALREVSRDLDMKTPVELIEGDRIPPIELQRAYLRLAQRYQGESEQTDWVLREWESVLDDLERDPLLAADRVDWVSKRLIVDQYRAANDLDWSDDSLHSIDLEYHNIDPALSLFHGWQQMGKARRVTSELDILDMMTDPPSNTRALGRSKLVAEAIKSGHRGDYYFDWSMVILNHEDQYDLVDPFDPYADVLG